MSHVRRMSLQDLPVEILDLILHSTSPIDTFHIHLACHELALKTETAISISREKAKKLHVQSDLHPLTVPALLRRVLYNDRDIWHIQRLELWGYRSSWEYWTEHRDLRRHFPWLNIMCPRDAYFSDTELDMLKKICIGDLGMTSFRANNWVEEMKSGNDGPMKVMLIALLPRLKRLVFVSAPRVLNQSTWHYVLDLLSQYVRMRQNPSFSPIGAWYRVPDWPPGLKSIEALEIYTSPRHPRMGDHVQLRMDLDPEYRCVELLLRLPKLKRAYLQLECREGNTRKLQSPAEVEELCLMITGTGRTGIVETCNNLRFFYASEGPFQMLYTPEGPFRPNVPSNVQSSLEMLPSHHSLDKLYSFPSLKTVELTAENFLTFSQRSRDPYSAPRSFGKILPHSVRSVKIVRDVPMTMSQAPPDPERARWVMKALTILATIETRHPRSSLQIFCLSDLLQGFDTGFAHIAGVRSWEVWREALSESSLEQHCHDLDVVVVTASHVPCEHGCYGPGSYEARHGPMLMSTPRNGAPLDDSGFAGWTTALS